MHGLIFGFKAECEYSVLNSGAIDMEVKSNHVFVTVHSVHSNVAKIHSKLPAAMEFWRVCLGILAYSCQNTSRDSGA